MTVCSALLLMLLLAPQDAKKTDAPLTREQRAALVDRIMGEPSRPTLQRPARVELPPEPPDLVPFNLQQKQIHFEMIDTNSEEDGEVGPPVIRGRVIGRDPVVAANNFDRFVFGEVFKDEEGRRIALGSLLTDKIHIVQNDQRIDYDQLQKLRLAGSGDIKRFLTRVEKCRAEFEEARHNQQAAIEFLARLRPLMVQYKEGPFDSDSLFGKTLRKMTKEESKKPAGPAPTGVDEVTPPRR